MNHTARFVLKIIAASLAVAALACLVVGSWGEVRKGGCCIRQRLSKKYRSEYDDYADEELFDE